jgi:hypothetical protein
VFFSTAPPLLCFYLAWHPAAGANISASMWMPAKAKLAGGLLGLGATGELPRSNSMFNIQLKRVHEEGGLWIPLVKAGSVTRVCNNAASRIMA